MHELMAVTLFMLLAAMAPGVDFAMVVRNSLLYSFLALGIFLHMVKRALGRVQRVLTRMLGGMMFYFGVRLALAEQ